MHAANIIPVRISETSPAFHLKGGSKMRKAIFKLDHVRSASALFIGLGLLFCCVSQGLAGADVKDSPLFARVLDSSLDELTLPSNAFARWSTRELGESFTNALLGRPAYARQQAATVYGEKATLCYKDNSLPVTHCDPNSGMGQICHYTVHSQWYTQCNKPGNRTVCIDGGTQCPGDGASNQCSTAMSGIITDCEHAGPTLCYLQGTGCEVGDRNRCYTVGPGDEVTRCQSGHEYATLCNKEVTGCSRTGHRVCLTFASNTKTYCASGSHVTVCLGAITECIDDLIREGCDGFASSLRQTITPRGNNILVVANTGDPFWGDPALADLEFNPPGPSVAYAVVYDSTETRFYIDFPVEEHYDVLLHNGVDPPLPTTGLHVMEFTPIPTIRTAGIILLTGLLFGAGIMILLRRRRQAS